jgi:site-specific recombinase XerD
MKSSAPSLLTLVQSFFQQHLVQALGASPHTIRAYRDTLRLFLEHLARQRHCGVDRLVLSDVTSQQVLDFLMSLETHRGNQAATRNCRLAALRSWVKHLLRHDPDHAGQYASILTLPAKRTLHVQPDYLEPEQFRLVLNQVDMRSPRGVRDGVLLLFLYNTGARVSEALRMRWVDLSLTRPSQVRLHCKGGKQRICPLWKQTAQLLSRLQGHAAAPAESQVFMNSHGQPLTRDGVAYLLRHYYQLARKQHSSLPKPSIHPHVLRHSCAVALLQAGIDLTAIRDYLGHSSVATTGRYLQTNLAMKREVLSRFWKRAGLERGQPKRWRPSQGLLAYLESL